MGFLNTFYGHWCVYGTFNKTFPRVFFTLKCCKYCAVRFKCVHPQVLAFYDMATCIVMHAYACTVYVCEKGLAFAFLKANW